MDNFFSLDACSGPMWVEKLENGCNLDGFLIAYFGGYSWGPCPAWISGKLKTV